MMTFSEFGSIVLRRTIKHINENTSDLTLCKKNSKAVENTTYSEKKVKKKVTSRPFAGNPRSGGCTEGGFSSCLVRRLAGNAGVVPSCVTEPHAAVPHCILSWATFLQSLPVISTTKAQRQGSTERSKQELVTYYFLAAIYFPHK